MLHPKGDDMNLSEFLETGKVNRNLWKYKQKKEHAKETIRKVLISHERPYIAISGGKDSIAMLFLVDEVAREMNKKFTVWAHISDASFPGTKEIIEECANRLQRELILSESRNAFEMLKNREMRPFGKGGVFYSEVRKIAEHFDCCFVGVRAFESKRRMNAVKIKGEVFRSESMGHIDVCYPLAWFRLADVASLILDYNAPMHPIYSKIDMQNERQKSNEPRWIRLGYLTQKDLRNKGTIGFIRINYPDLYYKLCEYDESFRQY